MQYKAFKLALAPLAWMVLMPVAVHAVTPQVSTNHRHTVGLKADGTVITAGSDRWGQTNVEG